MSKVASDIYELLGKDMVSHGLLIQLNAGEDQSQLEWKALLGELLSKDVEIGNAKLVSPAYVEFIAWVGNVEERIDRAERCVQIAIGRDTEFAYWLALRKNVDRFEAKE